MDAVAVGKSEDNFLGFSVLTVTAKLFSMQKHSALSSTLKMLNLHLSFPSKHLGCNTE